MGFIHHDVFCLEFLCLPQENCAMTNTGSLLKRCFDLFVGVAVFPLFLILHMVISVFVLLGSGRPVLFCQQRAGLNAKPFTLYKFRTMRTDCDPYGASPKGDADNRLTAVGRWLRKYSLDELPQIWNVLKGDMSLVGPRPLYISQIPEWNDRQKRRLEVKPGLTGLAQISGRASLMLEEKLELDVQYVERQSLPLDIKILFLTLFSVFRSQDIYEKRYSRTQHTRESQR